MEIIDLREHRPMLFQVIAQRIGDVYSETRCRGNAENIQGYVFTILSLCREYLEIHRNHFGIRREFPKTELFGNPLDSYIESTNPRILFPQLDFEKKIYTRDVYAIRKHLSWLFRKILEINIFLEKLDKVSEEEKYFVWINGNLHIRPISRDSLVSKGFKKARSGGGRSTSGAYSIGSKFDSWSGVFKARQEYDCDRCMFGINIGEKYEKEVFRMGEDVEIFRYHIQCPEDPIDPKKREKEEGEKNINSAMSLKKAA